MRFVISRIGSCKIRFKDVEKSLLWILRDSNSQAVTVGEVESSVALTRSAGTPGMDGLTGYMLEAIWEAIPDHLYLIFKSCMKDAYFLSEWKAITLLKSADKVKTNTILHRRFCLLSTQRTSVLWLLALGTSVEAVSRLASLDSRPVNIWRFGGITLQAERQKHCHPLV